MKSGWEALRTRIENEMAGDAFSLLALHNEAARCVPEAALARPAAADRVRPLDGLHQAIEAYTLHPSGDYIGELRLLEGGLDNGYQYFLQAMHMLRTASAWDQVRRGADQLRDLVAEGHGSAP